MITLAGSGGDAVQVITGHAADIECHVSYIHKAGTTLTPGRVNTASITTATTTSIVTQTASGEERRVKHISARNNHASQLCDVTMQVIDGTNTETVVKVTLQPGETLTLDELGQWHHYDQNGGEYPPSNMANRGDMEAETALDRVVSPGVQHYHPGHFKAWVKHGVTGNILVSYNITSVTDTAVGRAQVNHNVDFEGLGNGVLATVERVVTTLGVGDLKTVTLRFAEHHAGSVQEECYDFTVTTALQEDPTAWHLAALGKQV